MKFRFRLYAAIDAIVSRWPAALGGGFIRLLAWRSRFESCGVRVRFGDGLVVTGFRTISIGDGVSIMSGSLLCASEGRLSIGSNCSFNHNVFLGADSGEVIIGKDVLIGPNVVLRAADHEFDKIDIPIRLQGHRRGKIVIGDGVWLAANVVVTSGVTIGPGCVVGAGAIVTRDLPPMTVCVGSPAQPIRLRLTRHGKGTNAK